MLYAQTSMHPHSSCMASSSVPLLQGNSALHAACCQLGKRGCEDDTFPEIVKMLAAHGADVNAHQAHVSWQVCNECTSSLPQDSQEVDMWQHQITTPQQG